MKADKTKPPVYFIPEEKKTKKRTFLFIKTGTKSYAMSLNGLISSKNKDSDYNENTYKRG